MPHLAFDLWWCVLGRCIKWHATWLWQTEASPCCALFPSAVFRQRLCHISTCRHCVTNQLWFGVVTAACTLCWQLHGLTFLRYRYAAILAWHSSHQSMLTCLNAGTPVAQILRAPNMLGSHCTHPTNMQAIVIRVTHAVPSPFSFLVFFHAGPPHARIHVLP